ncbi:MAG: outer membrane protein assembly factor BamD [Candidatus Aureabacteria bacterium]|nr:outer membrane protein assembly factor BamD [Candidatus Auribacterota bacterium]
MKALSLSILFGLMVSISPAFCPGYAFPPRAPVRTLSPEEQAVKAKALWDAAQRCRQEGAWSRAARRYRHLAESFPESPFAPEALFQLGECLEKLGRRSDAFRAYQKILDDYPRKGDLDKILGRQFAIGELCLNQRRDYLLYTTSPALADAVDIFRQIVRTATFSDYSPRAQFNLAFALQEQGKYEEAELEYDLVKGNYPDSPVMPDALFQLGLCAREQSLGANYDQLEARKAVETFREFVRRYPDAPQVPRARELLNDLVGQEAEKVYDIGRYYERKDCPAGAAIYYRQVVEKFPGSSFAARAQERLGGIKPSPEAGE